MADLKPQAAELAEQVRAASAAKTPLTLRGGGSKAFFGRQPLADARPLALTGYRGVINYEPTELAVTVAAGTPLSELEAVLAQRGQMLGFEPPYFGPDATVGGTVACGLSGPRRPYAGSVRDFVLGVRIINGSGEVLRFGGEVMKNVAGYDVSRLMTGALGTLGPILEVSLRLLPRPAAELTLNRPAGQAEAIKLFAEWSQRPYPLSAAAWLDGLIYLRLSGAASAVHSAAQTLGGERLENAAADAFWRGLREQTLRFFAGPAPLWRLSLPPATAPLALAADDATLIDWGGAQRWLRPAPQADSAGLFAAGSAAGGHGQVFRGGDRRGEVLAPLPAALFKLQQRLRHSFDPAGIFNPGRLYAGL